MRRISEPPIGARVGLVLIVLFGAAGAGAGSDTVDTRIAGIEAALLEIQRDALALEEARAIDHRQLRLELVETERWRELAGLPADVRALAFEARGDGEAAQEVRRQAERGSERMRLGEARVALRGERLATIEPLQLHALRLGLARDRTDAEASRQAARLELVEEIQDLRADLDLREKEIVRALHARRHADDEARRQRAERAGDRAAEASLRTAVAELVESSSRGG